jgi:hypothetical protein
VYLAGRSGLLALVGRQFGCWSGVDRQLRWQTKHQTALRVPDHSRDAISFVVADMVCTKIIFFNLLFFFWYVTKAKIDYTFKLFDQYACVGHKLPD